jgi:hypothetical protein
VIRLSPSTALKERRLEALLAGRDARAALDAAVREAQVVGSLELAGVAVGGEDVRSARSGGAAPGPLLALIRAGGAVSPHEPFSVRALLAWHAEAVGGGALRTGETARRDPPPSPPDAIPARLAILEQWLNQTSALELRPAQQGALALARLVEIAPFAEGNGRVSRLACSHLMVRAGARPPILHGQDRARLEETLRAAFALHTEPLVALLEEASGRALDEMIRALEEGRA